MADKKTQTTTINLDSFQPDNPIKSHFICDDFINKASLYLRIKASKKG